MTAMLIVLRTFTETWCVRPLFDVAPISENERLASEWSLIFGPSRSGLGFPIVAHIDAQCTTTSSMLVRFVGTLSDVACLDLDAILRAYALNDDCVIELKIARRGDSRIRFHPEWVEFARELVILCQAFSAPLGRERAKEGEQSEEREAEWPDRYRLLAIASGAVDHASGEHSGSWEYIPKAPYLIWADATAASASLTKIGEVLLLYYSRCSKSLNGNDTGPIALDRETFNRLTPFLGLPTETLLSVAADKIPTVLFDLSGQHPVYPVTRIIVDAVRCIKMDANRGAMLMRLAARRPLPDKE